MLRRQGTHQARDVARSKEREKTTRRSEYYQRVPILRDLDDASDEVLNPPVVSLRVRAQPVVGTGWMERCVGMRSVSFRSLLFYSCVEVCIHPIQAVVIVARLEQVDDSFASPDDLAGR